MPELKDIEQFKPFLNSLGNEPEILEKKERSIEDVPPPEEGIPGDIRSLFATDEDLEQNGDALPDSTGEETPSAQKPVPEQSGTEDFLTSLDKVEEPPGGEEGGTEPDVQDALSLEGLEELTLDADGDSFFPVDESADGIGEEEGDKEPGGEPEFSPEEVMDFPLEETGPSEADILAPEEVPSPEGVDPETFDAEEPSGILEDTLLQDLEKEAPEVFPSSDEEPIPPEEESIPPEEESIPPEEESIPPEEEPTPFEEGFDLPEPGSTEEIDDEEAVFSDSFIEPSAAEADEEVSPSQEGEFSFDEEDLGFKDSAPSDEEKEEEVSAETEESKEGKAEGDDEDFDFSDFSLGDMGKQFGIEEEDEFSSKFASSQIKKEPSGKTTAEGGLAEEDIAGKDQEKEEFSLSDEDFRRLQEHLQQLPRNLKLIIEEQIGERGLLGKPLETVLEALVRGATAKELAAILGKITGENIVVPDQYEKLTGEDFEGERGTFAYIYRNNVLPLLRVFLLGAAALGMLVFFIFQYIYTPIYADILYRAGIVEIQEDNYRGGNDYFNQAVAKRRVKRWYYTYAENLAEKRQYPLAEEKYEQLLAVPKYRGDTKALLDYARLESETLGKYSEAEELLKRIFTEDAYQKEALLLAGDNYLRWGDEIDPDQWEEARYHYALLMQKYGSKSLYLFRMLRYLIRMDKYPEILQIKNSLQADPRAKIEAAGYAELAEYLLNRGEQEEILELLERAQKADPLLPEVYYQFSRYFRNLKDVNRETSALRSTLQLLQGEEPSTRKRLAMMVLAHNRTGEILYDQEAFLDAEVEYRMALERYEDGKALRRLAPRKEFGKIYANIGDLYYYVASDYNTALDLFLKGEKNSYVSSVVQYKKGYIYYHWENYREALGEFYTAAEKYSEDPNLLYATASTLYMRNDFFSAQGYYNQLIEELERERESIRILLIDEQPEHRALIENLMMSHNNLGVTLNRLYLATGDPKKNADSLVQFTRSSEYFDYLTRDPETMRRSKTINLAHINMKNLLYPVTGYQLQIYRDIPKDRQTAAFR